MSMIYKLSFQFLVNITITSITISSSNGICVSMSIFGCTRAMVPVHPNINIIIDTDSIGTISVATSKF